MIGPYCLWEPEKLTLNSVASSGNCSKMDDGKRQTSRTF